MQETQFKPIKKKRQEKIRIESKKAGELAHSDLHELSKGILLDEPEQKLYILGIIDDYTRLLWLELLRDKSAMSVSFGTMHIIGNLYKQYGIKFQSMMTDNGAEFGSGRYTKNKDKHIYEVMLKEFDIKHKYTKAYHPQTNGKIERFWRIIDEEMLNGTRYKNFEELRD